MDFSLSQERRDYYKRLDALSVRGEFSAESVVPDTQEDILRVLSAVGCAKIRSKTAAGGALKLTGEVSAAVLYVPESGQGAASISASVPFSFEIQYGDSGEALPVAFVRAASIEAQILNPRKVLVTAVLWAGADVYVRSGLVWSAPPEELGGGLRVKSEAVTFLLAKAVTEKSFVISDELELPQGKPRCARLLSSSCAVEFADAQNIGGKLIVKGTARAEMFYLAEGGGLEYAAVETPFSQLVEIDGGTAFEAVPMLTDAYAEPAGGPGAPAVSVEIHAVAQVVCRAEEQVCFIADAYSTIGEISAEKSEICAETADALVFLDAAPRGQYEFQHPCTSVLGSTARAGAVVLDGGTVRSEISVGVIYMAADGGTYGETFSLAAEAEADAGLQAVSAEVVSAAVIPAGMGLEIRLQARFIMRRADAAAVSALSSAAVQDEPDGAVRRPSVTVLRADSDDLWLIAKKYRADADEILKCNQLDGSEALCGRILLIP